MGINTQTVRIDLNTGKSIPTVFTHQNDNNRQITFALYNNGVAYTPSSATVKFGYVSPIVNGQYSVIAGNNMESGTVNGNTVTVTLPSAYTAVSGVGLLTMILTTSGNTIRPVNIKFVVQKSADGNNVIANASDFPSTLDEIVANYIANNGIEGVATSASFDESTKVITFKDSSDETVYTVNLSDLSPSVDDTLSQSGVPADAKKVGDDIAELRTAINGIQSIDALFTKTSPVTKVFPTGEYVSGGLTNGVHVANANRLHSKDIISYPTDTYWFCQPSKRYAFHTYDSSDTFVYDSGWIYNTRIITKIPANTRFRFVLDTTDAEAVFQLSYNSSSDSGSSSDSDIDKFRNLLINLFETVAYSSTTGAEYYAQFKSLFVSGGSLPEGYTEYDYASPYASTSYCQPLRFPTEDIQDITNYRIEFVFSLPSTAGTGQLFGAKKTTNDHDFALYVNRTAGSVATHYLGIDSKYRVIPNLDLTQKTTIVWEDGYATVNDVNIVNSNGASYESGQSKGLVGGIGFSLGVLSEYVSEDNYGITLKKGATGLIPHKLYSLKITDPDGQIVVDLVPCTNNNANAGFYDTVKGMFYSAESVGNDS